MAHRNRIRIRRVAIQGYKRFQSPFTLSFDRPNGAPADVVVIGGPNGGGKTSVLEAILLGLGLDFLVFRGASWGGVRHPHGPASLADYPGLSVEVDFDVDATAIRAKRTGATLEFKYPPMTGASGEPRNVTGEALGGVEFYSSVRAPVPVGAVDVIKRRPLVGDRQDQDSTVDSPFVPSAGRLRRMGNPLLQLKQVIVDAYLREALQRVLPGMQSQVDTWLKPLNSAWRAFHGDADTSIGPSVVNPDDKFLRFDLYILDAKGERICSVDRASSGELELLRLAGMLTMNKGIGVLLMDEPELHFHPQWQASILPALAELSPDTQVIIATHSDVIWDQVPEYSRHLLSDGAEGIGWESHEPVPSYRGEG